MNLGRGNRRIPGTLPAVCVLLSVPAVLVAIYYFTPPSFQKGLALDHTAPELHAFWTNALVHEQGAAASHLLGNVFFYLILIFPCWTLYRYLDRSKMFWIGLAFLLALTPIVVTLSGYIVYHEFLGLQLQNDRGFSGVVGAIDGFLIMSVLHTFSQRQEEPVALLSIGLYAAYLLVALGAITARLPALGLGILIFITTAIGTWTNYVAPAESLNKWGRDNPFLSAILALSAFVSAFALAVSLPTDITTVSGGLTNIVAHGAGIVLELIVGLGLSFSH